MHAAKRKVPEDAPAADKSASLLKWASREDAGNDSVPPLVIWDLDETLILFNSLVTGSTPFPAAAAAAEGHQGTPTAELKHRGAVLGKRMEALLWSLLDHCLGFEKLEESEFEGIAEALQRMAHGLWPSEAMVHPPPPPAHTLRPMAFGPMPSGPMARSPPAPCPPALCPPAPCPPAPCPPAPSPAPCPPAPCPVAPGCWHMARRLWPMAMAADPWV